MKGLFRKKEGAMGKNVFLLTVSLTLSVSLPGAGATWHVSQSVESSGDGASWETALKTIQEGIDASSDGDTVIVAEGTYFENIRFHGKNITLRSTDPLDPAAVAATIIDGNQSDSVVTFEGTETESCLLSGFTVRNGRDSYGGGIRGGYWSLHTRASIEKNVIAGNTAESAGGGIAHCNGTIRDNTVTNNTATLGGGLVDCAGVIVGNRITYNTALSGGPYSHRGGGGLARCAGLIEGNTISRNDASVGGGLYHCDHVIRNNIVAENSATGGGGGLADCDGPIEKNTISSNVGGGLSECDGVVQDNLILGNGSSKSEGGGLARCDGTIRNNVIAGNAPGLQFCHGTIQNNTIVGNRQQFGSDGSALLACTGAITDCIIWGNEDVQIPHSSEPTYSCIEGWAGGGEGNISLDPLFADPDGPDDDPETYEDNDYRLSPDSPCIDAGYNSPYNLPRFDLDGNLRIAFGGKSLTVDMGAYEFNSKPFAVSQISLDNNSLVITWHSQPGDLYSVWWTDNPRLYTWSQAPGSPVPSQGGTTSFTPTLPPSASVGIYRIQMR